MAQSFQGAQQTVKTGVDVVAASVAGAAWLDYLPPIAAACSILWFAFQVLIHWPTIKQRIKDLW